MSVKRMSFKSINTVMFMACALLCSLLAMSACEQAAVSGTKRSQYPYKVVATTGMVADVVRSVAGDYAQVQTLMGAGVDPHLYRPTRDDVSMLLAADVVFYNGLNLEGKMSDTFVKIAGSGKPVYAVTEIIDESYLLEPPEFGGHFDPHVWMDPKGWTKAVEAVIEKLCEFDPANADDYRATGNAYIQEIDRLNEYATTCLATVPSERRVLVTAHDAFNYIARAFGIEVKGIQGISTESEAGLRQIEALVEKLVSQKISAVFTESSVSDKNIKALIEGAKARGHNVKIGGELFSDAMGEAGSYEGTYIGMLDHNITTITRALGGKAPERGLNGKLKKH